MLLLSDTYSMVPILIHEFSFEACDPEPEQILERGRLYKVRLPPDQLNPEGYYDGTLKKAFLSRYSKKKKTGRDDLRAQTKKMKLPEPGEDTQNTFEAPQNLTSNTNPRRKKTGRVEGTDQVDEAARTW